MSISSKPIALLITAYNRQERLERTLASLEAELHLLDVVLVDDGSTPPINIDKFSRYPIHLIRLPENRGAMAASNAGLKFIYEKNYEFIARLDSDDVVISQRFTKQLAFMRSHPDIGMLGGQYHAVNTHGDIIFNSHLFLDHERIKKALCVILMLHHPTLIMRTAVARKNGFYDGSLVVAEDYDFCWRMLNITKVANLPDFLINYEIGALDSLSKSKRRIQAINGLKIKLHYFNIYNPYAYLGLIASLMDITDTLKYISKAKIMIMDKLFTK